MKLYEPLTLIEPGGLAGCGWGVGCRGCECRRALAPIRLPPWLCVVWMGWTGFQISEGSLTSRLAGGVGRSGWGAEARDAWGSGAVAARAP
eukprot:scaffold105891_cov37-Tisochrysis_lutea.AAC.1